MFRLILIVVVLFITIVSGLAVALYHYYGWTGLIAFPFLLIALIWLTKVVITKMVKKFFTSLIGVKSGVLRDAAVQIHSIVPVPKPADPEPIDPPEDGEHHTDSADDEEPEPPRHYFAFDMTITPTAAGPERSWEPSELLLASTRITNMEELSDEDKEVGTCHEYRLWNGTEFAEDEIGKQPGPQRLRMTFAVNQGATGGWLQYYDQPLCEVTLPPWTPAP